VPVAFLPSLIRGSVHVLSRSSPDEDIVKEARVVGLYTEARKQLRFKTFK
jgi:hypothetical protein